MYSGQNQFYTIKVGKSVPNRSLQLTKTLSCQSKSLTKMFFQVEMYMNFKAKCRLESTIFPADGSPLVLTVRCTIVLNEVKGLNQTENPRQTFCTLLLGRINAHDYIKQLLTSLKF